MVLAATGNVFQLLLTVLFMLITLFFVYKDGNRMVAQLDVLGERILPARWQRFSRVVPATINSTVTGMGLIALGGAWCWAWPTGSRACRRRCCWAW